MKDIHFKFLSLVCLCTTILVSLYLFGSKDFYLKQLPSEDFSRTLAVRGEGKVYAQPDVLTFTVDVFATEKTSVAANQAVKEKIKEVQAIFSGVGLAQEYVQTTNISLYPEYDYKDGYTKILGYKSSYALQVKIKKANTDNVEKGPKVIESLLTMGGVSVQNIAYDIEDKTAIYQQARALAVKKAKQKAKEMAEAVGISLGRPLSINEENSWDYPRYYGGYANNTMVQQNVAQMESNAMPLADTATNGLVSLGQLPFSSTISLIYSLE